MPIEIKTVMQVLYTEHVDLSKACDAVLADVLNDGWEVLDCTVTKDYEFKNPFYQVNRILTLRRGSRDLPEAPEKSDEVPAKSVMRRKPAAK